MPLRVIPGITKGTIPAARVELRVAPSPKQRVLAGVPESPKRVGNRMLHSLVPDFPLPEIPDYLWGRSQTRRAIPIKMRLFVVSQTQKAWKVSRELFSTNENLLGLTSYWLPKAHVYIHASEGVRRFEQYDIWLPAWLHHKAFIARVPEQTFAQPSLPPA